MRVPYLLTKVWLVNQRKKLRSYYRQGHKPAASGMCPNKWSTKEKPSGNDGCKKIRKIIQCETSSKQACMKTSWKQTFLARLPNMNLCTWKPIISSDIYWQKAQELTNIAPQPALIPHGPSSKCLSTAPMARLNWPSYNGRMRKSSWEGLALTTNYRGFL